MSTDNTTPQGRATYMDQYIDKNQQLLINLYSRWLDEQQYEDFNDYAEHMKKHFEHFVKATKRPFGFIIKPTDFPYQVHITINSRSIGWKAIKG